MFGAVFVIQLWLVRSRLLLLENERPVYARKPWMCHNFLSVGGTGTESSERILIQEFGANIGGVFTQEWEI
tara:strand:+ start:229 stop:441 length:213 start_codon:yes stop_codon:yes gene_type:complete